MPTRHCPIDLSRPEPPVSAGHLRLGGADPRGNRLDVTNRYLTWNGRPFYVVSGEFHFSRYPPSGWEDELRKVKAGGVNTVATYLFWNYHEEQPGEFAWDGQRDLRRFVELCGRHDLQVILRIGPFVHGEWRNGGLPDWLYGRPLEVRSNDPAYLERVARWYAEIGRQVQGMLFGQGGPIIGVQLENEYMHAGAPWEVVDPVQPTQWITAGRDGAAHLKALKRLAVEAGLEVPLYLVTAWGAPIIEDETLPVLGGYAYPVWVDDPGPSDYYLFDPPADAADRARPPERARYPLIYAEMQGGIQVRYHNRPSVPARSVEAMALVCVGKGSNWLGYYMYHGGTTPRGWHGFNHERLHPQLSYDFQAPLGEFGQCRPSYHALRVLHLFLNAFGESLAPMDTVLPAGSRAIRPDNASDVRYCARASADGGYLFVNNFQDHRPAQDLAQVVIEVTRHRSPLRIPQAGSLTVAADVCFILPFQQMLADARLEYATAQPLTRLIGEVAHYFFFAPEGLAPEYCFAADTVRQVTGAHDQRAAGGCLLVTPVVGADHCLEIETAAGRLVRIITLSRAEAEQTWQGAAWGAERVVVSPVELVFVDDGVEARTAAAEWAMTIWPPLSRPVATAGAACEQADNGARSVLSVSSPASPLALEITPFSPRKLIVRLPAPLPADLSEAFLQVDYEGDTGMAFIHGRLVADNFNNGLPWVIGLKRFESELQGGELCLVFSPRRTGIIKNTSSQLAGRAEFEGQEELTVKAITVVAQRRLRLTI